MSVSICSIVKQQNEETVETGKVLVVLKESNNELPES